jgi:hypothetical protein
MKAKVTFSSSKHPVQFWGAPSLLFNESQQYSCWGVKLTTCLLLVSGLKMSGLLLLLPPTWLYYVYRNNFTIFTHDWTTKPLHNLTAVHRDIVFDYCISREKQQLSVTAFYQFQLLIKSWVMTDSFCSLSAVNVSQWDVTDKDITKWSHIWFSHRQK